VTAPASAARRLRALHHGARPLVLPNVWDCASARVFAGAGFGALATSSGAVAASLGYADGQQTPAGEMFAAITRIARCVDVPVTADVEAGYGLAPAELAGRLTEAGAAGCNIEDSGPATGLLADPERQADYLAGVHDAAGEGLVINARVDVFVRARPGQPDPLVAEAVARARRSLAAGADCCYPILAPLAALPALVAGAGGPVNAMCWPGGPSLAELMATGVARITFGSSLHQRAVEELRAVARALGEQAGHAELFGARPVLLGRPVLLSLPWVSGTAPARD
jgi:2-methylisocitrate lyase-like PEP mutase family enzyme